MPSIFSRIIAGELPAHVVFESPDHLAFLDIMPVQPGHTLVVPKVEVDRLFDLDEAAYTALWATARTVAHRLRTVLDCQRVCVMVEGYAVPHAHIHMIPTNDAVDFRAAPRQDVSAAELAAIAARLRQD